MLSCFSRVWLCTTLWTAAQRLLCPWDSAGKNAGVGCHFLLQSNEHAAAAKSHQSCPTLCDSIDGSPPGSSVPGILQARMLEWVAISFSSAWKCKVKVKSLSHVRLFTIPWTVAYQAPPSMGFSRQEYGNGLPLHSPKKEDIKATKWEKLITYKRTHLTSRRSLPSTIKLRR